MIKNKKAGWQKPLTVLMLLAFCAMLLSGCGCGKKKEKDAASTGVMKITITPEATPTPAPENTSPDAVVTNGNMTMINPYLAEKAPEE